MPALVYPHSSPCRKHIPGFDRQLFKQDSLGLYRDVCRLLAAGDRSSLRQLVTPAGGRPRLLRLSDRARHPASQGSRFVVGGRQMLYTNFCPTALFPPQCSAT